MLVASVVIVMGLATLVGWRSLDHRADCAEMDRLARLQPTDPPRFSADMVTELPEPARRYFGYTISAGTPLYTVAKIEMQGRFSLGTKDAPNYMDITATQVLAAPNGFVWKMSGGSGLMRMSGSDSGAWTRFWLAGIAPIARFGGNHDHRRSAFGRYIAEAVFWTPAALLPSVHTSWTAVTEDTARLVVKHNGLEQSVDITVDGDGRPIQIEFPRWSNANPTKVHQIQPFGGYLSVFKEFQGFRLPTHIEAGNFFGTDEYFAFFIADVTNFRFPRPGE